MFSPEKSILVVIDVQGNLAYRMHDKDKLFRHIQALIKAAHFLNIPIVYTEQAPDKIGATVPEIAQEMMGINPITKKTFSCALEGAFMDKIRSLKRKEIIICGIETHVCVFQTIHDLMAMKYEVQVVADAVSSRSEDNKTIALKRLEGMGVTLTCVEMLVTELLRTSEHKNFKEVLQLIR